MTVKSISTLLLALACAATVLAQTSVVQRLPAQTAHQAPSTAQTNDTPSEVRQLPVRSSSLSRNSSASAQSTSRYLAPTAKSDDLVESPATNVVKGAFGYTLGAIWNEPIPEDAEPVVVRLSQSRPAFGELGEVTFSVKPKMPFPPFETVTLCVSTNERRIAAIATETPRMTLAESYMETREKISEIAKKTAIDLGIDSFPYLIVTNWGILQLDGYHTSPVIAGKLYREYLKTHPDDPDKDLSPRASVNILKSSSRLIAGSRYNVRRELGDRGYGAPDYLQQIWQLFELAADYYPYAGDVVIRFSVRDVEDRTAHTNLVSVADLKRKLADETAKRTVEAEKRATSPTTPMRPGIVRRRSSNVGVETNAPGSYLDTLRRRQANRAAQAAQNAEEIAKLREEIAQAAQTSKEEAAKRERAINLELISRGQEPLSPIELTSEKDAQLRKRATDDIHQVKPETQSQAVTTPETNEAQTNRIQNICGIPLGGMLKDMGIEPQWEVSFFAMEGITNKDVQINSIMIPHVRHLKLTRRENTTMLFGCKFFIDGHCLVGSDTIFSAQFKYGNRNNSIPSNARDNSEARICYRKLQMALCEKYGQMLYAKEGNSGDKRAFSSRSVWRSNGLLVVLAIKSYIQIVNPDNTIDDYSDMTLQYIREDLLPKAQEESDAYEAAKKAEAERKAKADAEAWPEEMKKAMESL